MDTEKEKAKRLLDEEEERDEEESKEETQTEEKKEEPKKEEQKSPAQALREMTSGTMKLLKPFRARSQDVEELRFDFCSLTSEEILDALDSVATYNYNVITNKQALALFASSAAKFSPEVDADGHSTRLYDARDIRRRLGPADAIQAIKLAKLFYSASSQAGENNISRE